MGNEVDFMVHGYVPLNIFGHEVWLTTTHVCLLIVCLFMLVIGLIVNNKMKHATECREWYRTLRSFMWK